MENSQLILYAIVIVVGVIIFMRAAKTIFRFAIIIILSIFVYLLLTGKAPQEVFKPGLKLILQNNSIDELQAKHCAPGKETKTVCQCIITPIVDDLNRRFSDGYLEKIKSDNNKITEEVLRSYERKKTDIEDCIKQKGEDKVKVIETLQDLYKKSKDILPDTENKSS